MCRNGRVPHPLYPGLDAPNTTRSCDAAGNMLSCQLCPLSPTYWGNTDPGPAANPWDGTRPPETAVDPITMQALAEAEAAARPDYTHVIDAGSKSGTGWYAVSNPREARNCTLCARPTTMRSPKHVPCHKVCAEEYNAGRRVFVGPR